ncbi:MAG: DUF5071 domain-containing protein [Marinomonas sp.]
MMIVPRDKCDIEACKQLAVATDSQVLVALPELLEWLQDLNWPVAGHIIVRVSLLEVNLDAFLLPILTSTDDDWKYWILSGLMPELPGRLSTLMIDQLVRMRDQPTVSEQKEEVDIESRALLEAKG